MGTPRIVRPADATTASTVRMYERHFSPAELGDMWGLSADTVRRMFENESGVLVFENPVKSSSRRFRTLRIPESVAQRVYSRFSNCGSKIRCR